MADVMIISMSTNAAAKEPINDPEVCSQKELNCWQIANQLALAFPFTETNMMPQINAHYPHRVKHDQDDPTAFGCCPDNVVER
ncbi:hypothetical protein QQP08_009135 [Theobroma cacao]|nr:hypothetical protein QQP08_009135 [Theobroma cacao]